MMILYDELSDVANYVDQTTVAIDTIDQIEDLIGLIEQIGQNVLD